MTNVSLLKLNANKNFYTLNETLNTLGYKVNITHPYPTDLPVSVPSEKSIVVLLADQSADITLSVLKKLQSRAILALLPTEQMLGHQEWLTYCNEFACWPCHIDELKVRIDRLQGGSFKIMKNDDGYLQEFRDLNMLGRSDAFKQTLKLIKRISLCDAPVMIEGETGTGKELAARAIHYTGARQNYPFIPVNCGAIPENLIENELFGHAKGAYTGATNSQCGLISQAQGGTLFLDEIDTLSLKAQVALLRFLQDKVYKPLGAQKLLSADVRVIAASNALPEELVSNGKFRQDLMFRLNIMSLQMPPLRERQGDIELLAESFLANYKYQNKQPNKYFHPNTIQWMKSYSWPGNVRELENFIQRQFFLADDAEIDYSDYNVNKERRKNVSDRRGLIFLNESFSELKSKVINDFERKYLQILMTKTQGNVSRAAQIAGKERRALGKLLKKHELENNKYKKPDLKKTD